MKRIICFLMCILVFCTACGCRVLPDSLTSGISVTDGDKFRTVEIDGYNVSIDIPNDLVVDMNDTDLDLFCSNGDFSMGVFCYSAIDLAEGDTSKKLWERQCEYDLERFKKVQNLDHKPDFKSTDKTLDTALHSFENEGTKLYAYYIFAEAKENPDTFVWITFMGVPSEIRDSFDDLERIVDSIAFK